MPKKMEFAKAITFNKFPGETHPETFVVTGIQPNPETIDLVEVNDLQDESMVKDWAPGMRTPGTVDITISGGMFDLPIGSVGKIKVTMTPITTSADGTVTRGETVTIVEERWAIVTKAAPTKLDAGQPVEFGITLQLLKQADSNGKNGPIMAPARETSSNTSYPSGSGTPQSGSGEPGATGGEDDGEDNGEQNGDVQTEGNP